MAAQRYEHRVFGSNRPGSTVYDNPAVARALPKVEAPKKTNKSLLSSLVDKLSGSSDDDDDSHVVLVFHEPGVFKIVPPRDATVCFVTAAGAGQGGGGASITKPADGSPATVSSGSGGAAGAVVVNKVIAIEDHSVVANRDNWSLLITVGHGGDGGLCGQRVGQPGEPTIIEVDSPCHCCARTITVPGGSQSSEKQGTPGVTVVGSQGTPDGGDGASSDLADGGRGGTVAKKNSAAGRPGGVGGAGGGGASPWGSCKLYTGGRGGNGLVRLEFA